MKFEFDPAKSAANKAKHDIDFVEAQALWQDDQLVEIRSNAKISDETRFLVIGQVNRKCWTAICTMRGEAVRIISVRRARREEVEHYEGT